MRSKSGRAAWLVILAGLLAWYGMHLYTMLAVPEPQNSTGSYDHGVYSYPWNTLGLEIPFLAELTVLVVFSLLTIWCIVKTFKGEGWCRWAGAASCFIAMLALYSALYSFWPSASGSGELAYLFWYPFKGFVILMDVLSLALVGWLFIGELWTAPPANKAADEMPARSWRTFFSALGLVLLMWLIHVVIFQLFILKMDIFVIDAPPELQNAFTVGYVQSFCLWLIVGIVLARWVTPGAMRSAWIWAVGLTLAGMLMPVLWFALPSALEFAMPLMSMFIIPPTWLLVLIVLAILVRGTLKEAPRYAPVPIKKMPAVCWIVIALAAACWLGAGQWSGGQLESYEQRERQAAQIWPFIPSGEVFDKSQIKPMTVRTYLDPPSNAEREQWASDLKADLDELDRLSNEGYGVGSPAREKAVSMLNRWARKDYDVENGALRPILRRILDPPSEEGAMLVADFTRYCMSFLWGYTGHLIKNSDTCVKVLMDFTNRNESFGVKALTRVVDGSLNIADCPRSIREDLPQMLVEKRITDKELWEALIQPEARYAGGMERFYGYVLAVTAFDDAVQANDESQLIQAIEGDAEWVSSATGDSWFAWKLLKLLPTGSRNFIRTKSLLLEKSLENDSRGCSWLIRQVDRPNLALPEHQYLESLLVDWSESPDNVRDELLKHVKLLFEQDGNNSMERFGKAIFSSPIPDERLFAELRLYVRTGTAPYASSDEARWARRFIYLEGEELIETALESGRLSSPQQAAIENSRN